jgi:hypothetical protein
MSLMNNDAVERACDQLWRDCQFLGWGSNPTTDGMTWKEFSEKDPIGASEFRSVVERVLCAADPAIWQAACVSQVLSELPDKVRKQIPEIVRYKLATLVSPAAGR